MCCLHPYCWPTLSAQKLISSSAQRGSRATLPTDWQRIQDHTDNYYYSSNIWTSNFSLKQKMVHCIKGRGSGGSLKWRLHLMNSSGEETQTGRDWIGLDVSGLIRVRKHWSVTSRSNEKVVCICFIFFLLFFLFLFCLLMVSWWALYDWMSEVREIEKTISCVKSRLIWSGWLQVSVWLKSVWQWSVQYCSFLLSVCLTYQYNPMITNHFMH